MIIRIFLFVVFILPHFVFAHSVFAMDPSLESSFQTCEIPEVQGARCGKITVLENRKLKGGRKIDLNVVILPALDSKQDPDPIFILQGGPGQAATQLADFYAEIFGELRKTRDIVLVDQRGTGKSNLLQCDVSSNNPLAELLPVKEIAECRKQLEQKADLRMYTTPVAMEDLNEVRTRLGYKQINIYGTSYGTWAALNYLRQFPESVRSLVLKGVVPPTMELSVTTAFDSERSLDAVITGCQNEPACAAAFPELRKEYAALIDQLRKGPIPVKISDTQTASFTRTNLMLTLRALLHSPGDSTRLPLMIHQAATGNFAPLIQISAKLGEGYRKMLSIGMFLSIYCSEEIPRIDVKNLPKDMDLTFHGDTWLAQFLNNCPDWPKGEIPASFYRPVSSDKPVLLISGGFDPVTPPRWAAEAAKTLSNNLNVVVPEGGHSFHLMQGCVDRIITEFVQNGSGKEIDTSCALKIRRPPFVLQ